MKDIAFAMTVTLCAILIPACSKDAEDTRTETSQTSSQATPVVIAVARYDFFVDQIEALGTATANEAVIVTADVTGRITRINFEDGLQVEQGSVLVELDSEEEEASLVAAQANLTTQQNQYRRLLDLRRQISVAQTTLDEQANVLKKAEAELEIARARLHDRTIEAPFAGKLGMRRVSLGALVNPGAEIVTLDDLSVVKVDFSIPETLIPALKPGLRIEAASVAYPDDVFTGAVTVVDSRVDPVTRTIVVRAEMPNPEGLLRPGMLMTVNLIKERTRSLVIPEASLTPMEDRQYVYLVNDENQVQLVEVTIGRRRPGEVEVLNGLKAGDGVVVEGTTRVRPGVTIEIVSTRGNANNVAPTTEATGNELKSVAKPPTPNPSIH